MKKTLNNKGFTLVEMAIVLVIVGLLIGMGAGMIGPLTNRAKTSETRDNLSAISSSLQGFAASNNRLPTLMELPTIMKTPNDAWGGALQYITTSVLTTTPPSICNYRTTTLSLRICNDAACTTSTTINNIAYLVLSRGTNGNNQTAVTPAPLTNVPTTINTYLPGMAVDNYAGDINQPTDEYDDILVWSTLDELRSKIGCQGAQLKILNNELPAGTTSSVNIAFTADGGVPFAPSPLTYRWCINTLPAGLTITSGGIQNADCWTANEATWGTTTAAQNLIINQTAGLLSGSYQITVVARDNQEAGNSLACNSATPGDNCTQKTFVLTVSP